MYIYDVCISSILKLSAAYMNYVATCVHQSATRLKFLPITCPGTCVLLTTTPNCEPSITQFEVHVLNHTDWLFIVDSIQGYIIF